MNNGCFLVEGEQLAQLLNALTVTPDLNEEVAIRVFFPTGIGKNTATSNKHNAIQCVLEPKEVT